MQSLVNSGNIKPYKLIDQKRYALSKKEQSKTARKLNSNCQKFGFDFSTDIPKSFITRAKLIFSLSGKALLL